MAGRQEAYLRLLPPAVFAGVCRFLRFYGEKSSVSICLCVHLLLNLWKIGSGLAKSKFENCVFILPLRSPFAIFE